MQKNSLFPVEIIESGADEFSTAHKRVLVSFSGGKDSVATLLRCLEVYPAHIVEAVFCDTGDEAPETYEYLRYIHENIHPITRLATKIVGEKSGKRVFKSVKIPVTAPVEYVRKNFHTVYDEVIAYYERMKARFDELNKDFTPYPNIHNRHCTRTLKIQTFMRYLTSIVALEDRALTVHCLGIRRNESQNRRKQAMFAYNSDTGVDEWYPIVNYTVQDVWAIHDKYGVERNPVYEQDKRSNCVGCVFAGIESMQKAINKHGASIMNGWLRVERETGYKMWGHVGISDVINGANYKYESNPLFTCATGFCDT